MRKTTALIALLFGLGGCGGESSSEGSGGASGSGGAVGGSGGAVGGSGGAVGGSGGAVGGSGGAVGGSGGAVGGSGGAVGGSGGAVGGSGGAVGGSGGAVGGSGGAVGGSGGGGGAKPECATDGDCKIFSDCCSCLGVPNSENPVSCPTMCLQDKCGELGAPKQASCLAGRCVTGFVCDSSKVTCKAATPSCDPGQVPLVTADGTCWTGSCVPATECKSVKGCTDCTGPLVCASWVTQLGPQHHCVDVPASCGGDFSCTCLGSSVCTGSFSACQNYSGLKGVSCSCPNC